MTKAAQVVTMPVRHTLLHTKYYIAHPIHWTIKVLCGRAQLVRLQGHLLSSAKIERYMNELVKNVYTNMTLVIPSILLVVIAFCYQHNKVSFVIT